MARGNQRPRVAPVATPARNTTGGAKYTPSGKYVRPHGAKPTTGHRGWIDPGDPFGGAFKPTPEQVKTLSGAYEAALASTRPAPAPADPGAGTPVPDNQPFTPGAAPSPYDSDFMAQVAKAMAENQQARRDLEQQNEYDQQDLAQSLARARRDESEALTQADYGANKAGLLYSGTLGKRRGLIQRTAADTTADQQTAFDRRAAARRAALTNMGEFQADSSSPTGYTASGNAGFTLGDLARAAVARRRAMNAGVEVNA